MSRRSSIVRALAGNPEIMGVAVTIRPVGQEDDMVALTALLHAAYGRRAAAGLRYWATHQSVADTRSRFAEGQGLVAWCGAAIVGTITVRPPKPQSEVEIYRDRATWTFGQFGVSPEFQGQGVGRALHDAAVAHAVARGAMTMALDTAAPATALIEMYRGWGYVVVGEVDWRPHTNYLSVVMAKALAARP